jgi:hypothetical protein
MTCWSNRPICSILTLILVNLPGVPHLLLERGHAGFEIFEACHAGYFTGGLGTVDVRVTLSH